MANDFDLDVQALNTQMNNEKNANIASMTLCTSTCSPTTTLCNNCAC